MKTPAKSVERPGPEQDLLAAVYAAPDDDAPRSALARFLTDRGDPRGEFITLQLAPKDDRDSGREEKLLAKNQAAWLGDLAPVLRYKKPVRCGPDPASWGMHVDARWHRGFLAGANLKLSAPRLKKVAPLREWATVEHVVGSTIEGADDAVLRALFGSLRGLRSVAGHFQLLRAAASVEPVGARLEHVGAWLADGDVVPALALLEAMPRLRRLEVLFTARAEPLLASPLWARLEELRFGSTQQIQVRREGRDLHLTMDTTQGEPWPWFHAILDALPVAEVASMTLRGSTIPQAWIDLAKPFPRVAAPLLRDRSAW